MTPTCASCIYFKPLAMENSLVVLVVGNCLRFPPSVIQTVEGGDTRPRVSEGDWCGEYRQKPSIDWGKV